MATSGTDGTVRCWDYIARKQLFVSSYTNAATCLTWAPLTLDPQARTIIVGFTDGVVRALYRAETAWLRIQSFKPHNGPVNASAVSSDGKVLATGGHDGLVFFMRCVEFDLGHSPVPYTPIGFSRIGGPIRSLCWRDDNEALLITCWDGTLYELEFRGVPEPEAASSFFLNLPLEKRNIDQPDANTDQTSDEVDPDTKKIAKEFGRVSCAIYPKINHRLLATFTSPNAGYVFEVDWQTVQRPRYVSVGAHPGCKQPTVTFLAYFHQFECLVTAHDDGAVTLRNFANFDENFLRIQAHDGSVGVNEACLSHDGNLLLSVGNDGLLVVNRVILKNLENVVVPDPETSQMTPLLTKTINVTTPEGLEFNSDDKRYPSVSSDAPGDVHDVAKENAVTPAEDVLSDAYSLEDERLKSDEDACRAAAERKKEVVRQIVLQMRRDFEELERENSVLPVEQQLDSHELIVDPAYVQTLEDQGEFLVEELRREHLYSSEKSKVQLKKLKDYFLSDLEKQSNFVMEGQSMRALLSSYRVGSFKTAQLTGALKQLLNQVHASMRGEEHSSMHLRTNSEEVSVTHDHALASAMSTESVMEAASKPVDSGDRQSTLEWRKMMRAQRKAKLAALLQKKPAEDRDDPRDLSAIERSKARLGDYKLKSTADYEVPQDQQVNALKKRQQMMMLQENINSIKVRYNKRFLALRDVKKLVFQSIIESNQHHQSLEASMIKLLDTYFPEKRSSGELKFNDPLFMQNDIKCNRIPDLGEWPDIARAASAAEGIHQHTEEDARAVEGQIEPQLLPGTLGELPLLRMLSIAMLVGKASKLEKDIKWCLVVRLHHEATLVSSKMKEHVDAFDRALCELRKEHIPLNSDLKAAELRLLLLFQVTCPPPPPPPRMY